MVRLLSDDREVIDVGGELPEEEALQSLLDDLDGEKEAEVRVYKTRGTTTKQDYLFTFHPQEYRYTQLLEHLRDTFGAGEYWLKFIDPRSQSRNKMIANKNISIGAPISNPISAINKSAESELVQLLREQNAQIARLASTQSQITMPQFDPMTMFTKMAEMMAVMKTVFPQPKEKSLLDQMVELKELQNLMSELGGNSEGEEPSTGKILMSLVDKLAPPLMAAIEKENEIRIANMRSNPVQQMRQPQNMNGTQRYLSMILQAAEAGRPVSEFADIAMQFITEDNVDVIHETISPENFVDIMKQQLPPQLAQRIDARRPWLDSLRTEMLQRIESEFDLTDEAESDNNPPHAHTNES